MASSRTIIFLSFALVAGVIAAPLEEPAGQDSKPDTTTTTATPSTSVAPETTSPAEQASTVASTPTDLPDISAYTNTSFTCYGRSLGYYADVVQNCKVYHFCLLGEYNGEPIYQRVSYLCMNEKVFDQQALDCVKESELKAPCKDSAQHYDISNKALRQAVLGSHASNEAEVAKVDGNQKSTTTTTTTQAP